MLAEAITLRNTDGYISRPVDQPHVQGKCLSCASPSVPSTIFKEDAIEPKTGIKFPAFLEDDSSPSAPVFSFFFRILASLVSWKLILFLMCRNFHNKTLL